MPQQLRDFEHEVQMHRRVSFRVRDMMKCFPPVAIPWTRCSPVPLPWAVLFAPGDDPQYIYDAVVRLIAKILHDGGLSIDPQRPGPNPAPG